MNQPRRPSIDERRDALLHGAGVEQLVQWRVIARIIATTCPVPAGQEPYAWYVNQGLIQLGPKPELDMRSICEAHPDILALDEREAIGRVIRLSGGNLDPVTVQRELALRRQQQ